MVAEVLVEVSNAILDKTFSYRIPSNMIDKLEVGMRVKVPFSNRDILGFVLNIKKEEETDYELKDIKEVVDNFRVLDDELLSLGKYMSDITLSSLTTCYQTMLPKALKAKVKNDIKPSYLKYISLVDSNVDINLFKNKQKEIVSLLKEKNKVLKKELDEISLSSVKTLLKNNIIKEELIENYRLVLDKEKTSHYKLLPNQQEICDEILKYKNSNEIFLLHGVTGSGKTNVYMEVIKNVIKSGKQVIVLVPEISLTPQIIKRFTQEFDRIAVLHSRLSDGEKYDEWRKIKNKEVDIVIGARSAIFAPFDNLGLIVIDEEHSTTYKQENSPRYNTIDIAKYRSKYHNCPIVLGSATPSLESYARAKKGVYHLLELKERFNNIPLPEVTIVDMNKNFRKNNSFFSKLLIEKIQEKIDKDEQVILFLNKRGYSSIVTCTNCGEVIKCPNCDISLTYHKTSNMLRCHYCGYATNKPKLCPKCHDELTTYGLGTERVEEELNKIINNAKIVRMDIDTTTKKGAHAKIINDFMDHKYNILLGTQMIAKGLDFPLVTLVGIINADISLNLPDFRSSEYTFELINQVSGRSGRGDKLGEVIIQTYNPDHYAIVCSKNNDYLSFYEQEMEIRKHLSYPPYYYLILLRIVSSSYEAAKENSNKIYNYLNKNLKVDILGPSMANIFRVNNKYHFQIIIKYKTIDSIMECLKYLNSHYSQIKDVKLEIDFNPIRM